MVEVQVERLRRVDVVKRHLNLSNKLFDKALCNLRAIVYHPSYAWQYMPQ